MSDDELVFKFDSSKKLTYLFDKKELVKENDEWLTKPCELFDFANPQVEPARLATTLFETQFREHGIGLTCNQIGLPFAVFSVGWEDANKQIFFNPKIVEQAEDTHLEVEGCLTYPGLWLKVKRPNWIKIQYQHVNGEAREETYYGMTARVLCHEMDHIHGRLFTDQVSKIALTTAREKRKKLLRKERRMRNETVG